MAMFLHKFVFQKFQQKMDLNYIISVLLIEFCPFYILCLSGSKALTMMMKPENCI